MAGVTKSKFAEIIDRSKAMVTKHDRAGNLVYTDDGLIDVEASKARINAVKDPARGGKYVKAVKPTQKPGPKPEPEPVQREAELRPREEPVSRETFGDVRKEREKQTIELNALKLQQLRGELVDRAGVAKAALENASAQRALLEQIPGQLVSVLAAENDPHKINLILVSAIERVCQQIADVATALPQQLIASKQ